MSYEGSNKERGEIPNAKRDKLRLSFPRPLHRSLVDRTPSVGGLHMIAATNKLSHGQSEQFIYQPWPGSRVTATAGMANINAVAGIPSKMIDP